MSSFGVNDIVDQFDWTCDPIQLGDVHLNCLLYADDIVLLSDSPNGLQNCLNKTYGYCCECGLDISFNKSKVMIFRREVFNHSIDLSICFQYSVNHLT